jgi:hypothetical protein
MAKNMVLVCGVFLQLKNNIMKGNTKMIKKMVKVVMFGKMDVAIWDNFKTN